VHFYQIMLVGDQTTVATGSVTCDVMLKWKCPLRSHFHPSCNCWSLYYMPCDHFTFHLPPSVFSSIRSPRTLHVALTGTILNMAEEAYIF